MLSCFGLEVTELASIVRKLWVGLDWGTHSSKWWYNFENADGVVGQSSRAEAVVDSTIHRSGDRLRMLRERTRTQSEVQDARLKRLLLKDPQGASYWEAVRDGIRVSLGEAVTDIGILEIAQEWASVGEMF
jgi:hypothetical protein